MNKSLSPNRLLYTLLSFLIVASVLSGCGHDGDKVVLPKPIEDTVANHVISIDVARALTASFRNSIARLDTACPSFKDSMHFGHAESFPTDVYVKLLLQHNDKQGWARGIRIYFGRGVDGEIKLVLVPYDKNGNDMIDQLVGMDGKPSPGTKPIKGEALKTTENGQAIEDGQRCPTACDDGSSGLN